MVGGESTRTGTWQPRYHSVLGSSLVLAVLAWGLGCSQPSSAVEGVGFDPAESSQPRGRGACTSDAECLRAHCEAQVCVDDCASDSRQSCSGGCDEQGRCLESPSLPQVPQKGSLLSVSRFPTADAGSGCIEQGVTFQPVTPTVTLLIDQSGSMAQSLGSGETAPSRWATLVATLGGEDSFVKVLDEEVRFGLALYTSQGGFRPEQPELACPVLEEVGVALGNFESIRSTLLKHAPDRDTPTAESVMAVTESLAAFGEAGPKYIILATDGEPDTCEDPNPHDSTKRQEAARALSVAAVVSAHDQGISTYVISLASDSQLSPVHLKDLAVAGAGGDPTAEAFTALDTAAVEAAFNTIISGVRSCDFRLEGRVESSDAREGSLVLDGQSLVFEGPDGWSMTNERTVRLLGAACDAVLRGASELAISFPCDAITILQ